MRNPWLDLPLRDYEGHMSLPSVGQAQMLAGQLSLLIERHAPRSVAIIGCAGGNGIDHIEPVQLERLVALDINPTYVEAVGARYANRVAGLELCCADIQAGSLLFEPVDLIYAALLFEYVDAPATLVSLERHCRPGGVLAALVQLPHRGQDPISPSPYRSLKTLALAMRLIAPEDLDRLAAAAGFSMEASESIELPSGKRFSLRTYRRFVLGSRDE